MRKALLFISLFASAIVLRAQIDVLYQGSVVNDTIVIYEKSPNEDCYIYLTCKNNQSENINVKVVSNRVYGSEGMEILSVCALGETCVPGTESRPFDIAANSEKEFDSWVMINEGLAEGTNTMFSFTVLDMNDEANFKTVFVKYIIGTNAINTVGKANANINLYPNPAKNMAYINYELPESNVANSKIEIRNMLGSVVKEMTIQNNNGTQGIDTSNMPNGVYLCSIVCNGKVSQTKKMVVKH